MAALSRREEHLVRIGQEAGGFQGRVDAAEKDPCFYGEEELKYIFALQGRHASLVTDVSG
jgi:hypothetical protein